jgi:hypothetical protein
MSPNACLRCGDFSFPDLVLLKRGSAPQPSTPIQRVGKTEKKKSALRFVAERMVLLRNKPFKVKNSF